MLELSRKVDRVFLVRQTVWMFLEIPERGANEWHLVKSERVPPQQ